MQKIAPASRANGCILLYQGRLPDAIENWQMSLH